jgi:hypothetical protein
MKVNLTIGGGRGQLKKFIFVDIIRFGMVYWVIFSVNKG